MAVSKVMNYSIIVHMEVLNHAMVHIARIMGDEVLNMQVTKHTPYGYKIEVVCANNPAARAVCEKAIEAVIQLDDCEI